jgi:hypothetical protein
MALERGNPLLRRWWRSQFRLRALHRSQVVVLGLPLVALIVVTALEAWVDARDLWRFKSFVRHLWWDTAGWYPPLFAPIATLFPSALLTAHFIHWDRNRRFDALLSAPITSRQWSVWLLVMATAPTAAFLIGWWGCFFAHRWHPGIFDHLSTLEKGFYLSLGYIPLQCLWSAAITLTFLARCRRVAPAAVLALLVLLLPAAMGFGLLWLIDPVSDRFILPSLAVINGLKLSALLFLLWDLHCHLRDRLAARVNP